MSSNSSIHKQHRLSLGTLMFWLATLVSVLMLIGAYILSRELMSLPDDGVFSIRIGLLESTLFTYGLGLGIFGAGAALTAPSLRRGFGYATVLQGIGFIAFAFVARQYIARNTQVVVALISIASALWAYSLILYLTILTRQSKHKAEATVPTEEQQQPLSPPSRL